MNTYMVRTLILWLGCMELKGSLEAMNKLSLRARAYISTRDLG